MEISDEDARRLSAAVRTILDILEGNHHSNSSIAYGSGSGFGSKFGSDLYGPLIMPSEGSFSGKAVDLGRRDRQDLLMNELPKPQDD